MRLTEERLRAMTLARQFPAIRGRGRRQLLELFAQLGPIQPQVPRAPFVTAAARLPGISYRTINDALAEHALLKTTNLRGTVHTTVAAHFALVDAARRPRHVQDLSRVLRIDPEGIGGLLAEIEAFCADDWRHRDLIVDRAREVLLEGHRSAPVQELDRGFGQNLIWGHSALIRRPRDDHWELRTDSYHRTARRVVGAITIIDHDAALIELARIHLGCYGPATRRDIAWWLGVPLGRIDQAIAALGDEIVRHTGPDGAYLLDLATIPARRVADPGLRLLPEYDGLLLGYAPDRRDRFISHDQLDRVWTKANGMFYPTVLLDGRLVGSWRSRGRPAETIIEITPLHSDSGLDESDVAAAARPVAAALNLVITDIRILPATA
ncbi:MAG: AlkZ family DNA glycosylase [Microlunatus sp.]|nr:AlkZ family DNA glycosylase [Microlunatus sp.]